ncbi:hypothetical protein CXU22_06245 [Akkermansia muciniphila]|uniref:Uncharacterized protein n=1 Tax=Akkermansia muciniphila TaxID=239935 RepID=A0A2N8HE34_9BACT|nr:hypothetical protein CXU22_06245 [Akkermansia muciniphila]
MNPFFTHIPASEILKSFFRTQSDENQFESTPGIDSMGLFCWLCDIHGKNSVRFFSSPCGSDIFHGPSQGILGIQEGFTLKIFNGHFQKFCGLF